MLQTLFLPFVLFSFRRSALQGPDYAKHRKLCERGTWLMLVGVIVPLAPWVIFVCTYKCAPPRSNHGSRWIQAASYLRSFAALSAFLIIGSTRRGPHIACEIKAMKAGFGVSAEDFDVASEEVTHAADEHETRDELPREADERAPLLANQDRVSRDYSGRNAKAGKEAEENVWDIFNSSCISFAFGSYVSVVWSG